MIHLHCLFKNCHYIHLFFQYIHTKVYIECWEIVGKIQYLYGIFCILQCFLSPIWTSIEQIKKLNDNALSHELFMKFWIFKKVFKYSTELPWGSWKNTIRHLILDCRILEFNTIFEWLAVTQSKIEQSFH